MECVPLIPLILAIPTVGLILNIRQTQRQLWREYMEAKQQEKSRQGLACRKVGFIVTASRRTSGLGSSHANDDIEKEFRAGSHEMSLRAAHGLILTALLNRLVSSLNV